MQAPRYFPIHTASGELLALRLAIRQQGAFLHAYLADGPTMRGALPLGSLHKVLAQAHPEIGSAWESFLCESVSAMLRHFGARDVAWLDPPADPPTAARRRPVTA